jgi:hypothetical protein
MKTVKIEMTLKDLSGCLYALNEVLNNNALMMDEREFSARIAVSREEAEQTLDMLGSFMKDFPDYEED